MLIRWIGHACFELKTRWITVVTDPYRLKGMELPRLRADVVTVSHRHDDHNNAEGIRYDMEIYRTPLVKIKELTLRSFPTWHDDCGGALRGENYVTLFDFDGVKICHAGDLGESCNDRIVQEIGRVDVLLLPVGGTYTLDARQAKEYVDRLRPRVVIPMHYKTARCPLDLASCEEFAELFDENDVHRMNQSTFETDLLLKRRDIGTKLVILEPENG